MELKFRDSKIENLEGEIEEFKKQLKITSSKDSSKDSTLRGIQTVASLSKDKTDRNFENLENQLSELNDVVGDKDAQLLILHERSENTKLKLHKTSHALNEMLSSGQIEHGAAILLYDILKNLEN